MTSPIAPARASPWFLRFFGGYTCRLLRKNFTAVRLEREGDAVLRSAADHDGPLILAFNHPSWWDPIVGVALRHRYLSDRPGLSPIEMAMFERFGFMRRLGMFGIDVDHPEAGRAMVEYVVSCQQRDPDLALFLTPQGEFADVRQPIVVRPGAGAVAAKLENVRVLAVLSEFVLWTDKRPEVLLLVRECARPEHPTTAGWTRSIRDGMQAGTDQLAALAIARDEAPFLSMLERRGSNVNPAYDLWQRLRGRTARVSDHRHEAKA